ARAGPARVRADPEGARHLLADAPAPPRSRGQPPDGSRGGSRAGRSAHARDPRVEQRPHARLSRPGGDCARRPRVALGEGPGGAGSVQSLGETEHRAALGPPARARRPPRGGARRLGGRRPFRPRIRHRGGNRGGNPETPVSARGKRPPRTDAAVPAPWRNDIARVLVSEEQIARRVAQLARDITRDFAARDTVVVAILNGTVMFLADLLRHLSFPLRLDFVGISSYGDG